MGQYTWLSSGEVLVHENQCFENDLLFYVKLVKRFDD